MPREIVYFTDWCLGRFAVPAKLREHGMRVVTHEEFGLEPEDRDEDWIPRVAARGHIILTKDKNIRRMPNELDALIQSKAYYFALGRADRNGSETADILLYHRPTIERMVQHRQPPVIAQLNQGELFERKPDGTLKLVKRRGR